MTDAHTRKGSGKSLKNFLIRILSNTKIGGSPIFFHNSKNPLKRIFQKNSNLLPSNGFTLHLCLVSVILDFFSKMQNNKRTKVGLP